MACAAREWAFEAVRSGPGVDCGRFGAGLKRARGARFHTGLIWHNKCEYSYKWRWPKLLIFFDVISLATNPGGESIRANVEPSVATLSRCSDVIV
jgi:hypothetical protein